MSTQIHGCHYEDKGNAIKVICYKDSRIEIEPVYYKDYRFKIITFTPESGALVEIAAKEKSIINEMLDLNQFENRVLVAISFWSREIDINAPILERSRELTLYELSKGVEHIYYTCMGDGAYDEQVHRHKITKSQNA